MFDPFSKRNAVERVAPPAGRSDVVSGVPATEGTRNDAIHGDRVEREVFRAERTGGRLTITKGQEQPLLPLTAGV